MPQSLQARVSALESCCLHNLILILTHATGIFPSIRKVCQCASAAQWWESEAHCYERELNELNGITRPSYELSWGFRFENLTRTAGQKTWRHPLIEIGLAIEVSARRPEWANSIRGHRLTF